MGVHADFETRSYVDLLRTGVPIYAKHPSTSVLTLKYRIDGSAMQTWRPGMPEPAALNSRIRAGGSGIFTAHNAAFEFEIWNNVVCRDNPYFPRLVFENMDCTMARAQIQALPGKLDQLSGVLNTFHKKDSEGYKLMLKMSKPRSIFYSTPFMKDYASDMQPLVKAPHWSTPEREYYMLPESINDPEPMNYMIIDWWYAPELVQRLEDYCHEDVETEEECDTRLPPLSPSERTIWQLDHVINARGVRFDERIIRRAVAVADIAKRENDKRMAQLTDGYVKKCTEVKRILAWLNARGIVCTTFRKNDFDDLVALTDTSLDWLAEEVIRLRRTASRTSNTKYNRMLECMGDDGRIRALLNYAAANTARWGGRLVQPQNFPRVDADTEAGIVEIVIMYLDTITDAEQCYLLLDQEYGDVLLWLSKCLRAMIIAEEGNEFFGGDFANIEGRLNSWLNGDQWKLNAFAAYDRGEGPDMYRVTAGGILGTTADLVTKLQRQAYGKIPELSLGYQGGVGAFINMGVNYNIKPAALVPIVKATTSAIAWDKMADGYAKATDKFGLPIDQWTAIKLIVRGWRDTNPGVAAGWYELQDAAIDAVLNPGVKFFVMGGRVAYGMFGENLYCQLPSGRTLCYHNPRVIEVPQNEVAIITMIDAEGNEIECETIVESGRHRKQVQFEGLNSKTKKWGHRRLYGGLQGENIVQATARDVMAYAMLVAEHWGFPLVLTVHDELLAELRCGLRTLDHWKQAMHQAPHWLDNFPLAASVWTGTRYTK